MVKSDEFVAPYIFPLNPDYVAARSLRSLRSISNIAKFESDTSQAKEDIAPQTCENSQTFGDKFAY